MRKQVTFHMLSFLVRTTTNVLIRSFHLFGAKVHIVVLFMQIAQFWKVYHLLYETYQIVSYTE